MKIWNDVEPWTHLHECIKMHDIYRLTLIFFRSNRLTLILRFTLFINEDSNIQKKYSWCDHNEKT
jgi:hypothetical protein